jgi:hypothetical protein
MTNAVYLQDLTNRLNVGGKYYALYCSLEVVQNIIDPKNGIPAIISCLKESFSAFDIPQGDKFAHTADLADYVSVLKAELSRICKLLDKPLVILFDEADCLSEDTLISFLRQLRNGYNNRSITPFVHSIALVGMRNIRDYKAKVRFERETHENSRKEWAQFIKSFAERLSRY